MLSHVPGIAELPASLIRADLESVMSQQVQQKQRSLTDNLPRPSLQARGYLVDEQGREIAITERMIQQACQELEQQWSAPRSQAC